MTLTPSSIQKALEICDEVQELVGLFISNQATFNPERASWKGFSSDRELSWGDGADPWIRVDELLFNPDDQSESELFSAGSTIYIPISELLGDWNLINAAAIDRQAVPPPPDEEYQTYLRLKAKYEP
jgi:hypothetical protein